MKCQEIALVHRDWLESYRGSPFSAEYDRRCRREEIGPSHR